MCRKGTTKGYWGDELFETSKLDTSEEGVGFRAVYLRTVLYGDFGCER